MQVEVDEQEKPPPGRSAKEEVSHRVQFANPVNARRSAHTFSDNLTLHATRADNFIGMI